MIVKQEQQGLILLGKMDNICKILKRTLEAGYEHLPAVWAIKLYLERN